MTPKTFATDFIRHWEDGDSTDPARTHSLDPTDNGNWSGGRQGLGTLVGSNHGITAAALALYRGVPVSTITRVQMRALTISEAADIALALYYLGPHLDLLAWNRATMSVFDMAWGAGTSTAVKLLQRMIGCTDDGVCGRATAARYQAYITSKGERSVAVAYAGARVGYYDRIIIARPANEKYRHGWLNRTDYYTPASPWWARTAAE